MAVELIMLKGLQASGKSSYAKQLVDKHPGAYKIINKDSLRLMLDNGHWSDGNEKFVLKVRDALVALALTEGKHAIVDDTNLATKHEVRLRELAKQHNALFRIEDFSHVPLEECIARDRKRPHYVGEKVILDTWYRYLRPKTVPPPFDTALPTCVICDLDGTLADLNGRNPYDASTCYDDLVRTFVWDLVNPAIDLSRIIFVSGRSDKDHDPTQRWIRDKLHVGEGFLLLMRKDGDMRRDSIIKREIYEEHIHGKFNVTAIVDDRPQVIRECWAALGFGDRIFNVGDGREF